MLTEIYFVIDFEWSKPGWHGEWLGNILVSRKFATDVVPLNPGPRQNPGRDPNLYLDFRAARRWLAANSEGRDVLNAFAFTCGHRRDDAIDSSR